MNINLVYKVLKENSSFFVISDSTCIHFKLQWNLVINEVLGTMKITLLYKVSHYIRVKKTKKYKELGPAKRPCYIRGFCYIRPLYEVPLYLC